VKVGSVTCLSIKR